MKHLMALAWMLCVPVITFGAEPALTEARLGTKQPIWVGQRVVINIDLLSETYFASAPNFLLPQVSEAILIKIDDRPVLGQKTIGDTSYTVQTHELAFFPQRAGQWEIPPIQIQFDSAGKPGEPSVSRSLATERLQFEVKSPPGSQGQSLLVSTTRFNVEETWVPDHTTLKVGDALKRQFVLTADGIPGMALPTIPVTKHDALSVYPMDLSIQDRTQRGEFTGKRIQTESFICQSEGTVEFPAIALTWFDTRAGELKRIVLPARTVEIEPGIVETATADAAEVTSHKRFSWKRASLVSALLIGFAVACARLGPQLQRRYEMWIEARRQSEPAAFDRLLHSIEGGEPVKVYEAAVAWAVACEPNAKLPPAARLDAWAGSDELRSAVAELQAAVVGRRDRWDGTRFAEELKRYRKALRAEQASFGRSWGGRELVELNP